jgi:enoyl-CoA hydratase/carnithine racemase
MRARRLTASEGRARVELLNRMVVRLVDFPRPTIAMVDGFAVGADDHQEGLAAFFDKRPPRFTGR